MDENKNVAVLDLLDIVSAVCGVNSYQRLVELLEESNSGDKRRYSFVTRASEQSNSARKIGSAQQLRRKKAHIVTNPLVGTRSRTTRRASC